MALFPSGDGAIFCFKRRYSHDIGVIPARGGSKGIYRKNVHLLNGHPLIYYTISEAGQSGLDDVVISTDDVEIAMHHKYIMRPPELAEDDTPMLPVIQHCVKVYETLHNVRVDAVMTLQPTSPLRTVDDIDRALYIFASYDNNSVVSVTEGIHPIKCYNEEGKPFLPQTEAYDKHKHKCYTRNGAIFITRRDLLDSGKLLGDEPLLYVMPRARSIDIDTWDDLLMAEAVLQGKDGEKH